MGNTTIKGVDHLCKKNMAIADYCCCGGCCEALKGLLLWRQDCDFVSRSLKKWSALSLFCNLEQCDNVETSRPMTQKNLQVDAYFS